MNAAFRIEATTRQIDADLAIGQETYNALCTMGDPSPFFLSNNVQLKGYDTPVTVWSSALDSVRRLTTSELLR